MKMPARLGQVIYWFATGIAALTLMFCVVMTGFIHFGSNENFYQYIAIALIAVAGVFTWLVGKGVRYVLAGY